MVGTSLIYGNSYSLSQMFQEERTSDFVAVTSRAPDHPGNGAICAISLRSHSHRTVSTVDKSSSHLSHFEIGSDNPVLDKRPHSAITLRYTEMIERSSALSTMARQRNQKITPIMPRLPIDRTMPAIIVS